MPSPIVLRFASIHPRDLGRIAMHGERRGGDLSHIDPRDRAPRDDENVIIGKSGWVEELRREIQDTARRNKEEAVSALERKGLRKQALKRQGEGIKAPFRASKGGPLREAILTVDSSWFYDEAGRVQVQRVQDFYRLGVAFFEEHFPGQVRHLRIDLDEGSPHFHAVLAPWADSRTKHGGRQRNLTPSAHPLLASYEAAQDAAGTHFSPLGLSRGSKDAAARRNARRTGAPPPPKRHHIPPHILRRQLAQRLDAVSEREQLLEAAAAVQSEVAEILERRKAAVVAREKAVWSSARAVEKDADAIKIAISDATRRKAEEARLAARRKAIAKEAKRAAIIRRSR